MAYQTGVSSSVGDLISALRTFALSVGFTDGSSWNSGTYALRSLSRNGHHYVFEWNDSELYLNTATGISGGAAASQPGACPTNSRVSPIVGPHVGYHFFSDGACIHVVVELVTNVFQHFSFGEIEKVGNWVGGAYVSSNTWHTSTSSGNLHSWNDFRHVRLFDSLANYGGFSNKGHIRAEYLNAATSTFSAGSGSALTSGANVAKCSPWDWGYELIQDSPNAFNTRAAIVPVEIVIASEYQDFTPAHWLQLGHIPTAAAINIRNLNPKETVNNDWMVFPLCQKNGPGTSYVNSGNIGMAYRK